MIKIKRTYDLADDNDGYRILVDRLWPRGISKEKAQIDLWLKEIAPSNELRKWYNHDTNKWEEFRRRYIEELKSKDNLINQIRDLEKDYQTVTLLYSAKDTEHANINVLIHFLNEMG